MGWCLSVWDGGIGDIIWGYLCMFLEGSQVN